LPGASTADRLKDMLFRHTALCGLLLCVAAYGQIPGKPPAFDVASVRVSAHQVGPDYNNQISYSPSGFSAKNVTLRRLIAEANHVQMSQVAGAGWIDTAEYDVEARTSEPSNREQMEPMLRSLLAARFKLSQQNGTRRTRVYELVVAKSGTKIHPIKEGEAVSPGNGLHFHGDMRQLADLLAVQLTIPAPQNPNEPVRASAQPIPVLDRTGLAGTFDFSIDIRPELGTDMFAAWKRALEEQLGVSIESREENLPVVVVVSALKIPTEN
jgi:uncharacterized protein (TIGR03435 family)